MHSIEPYYNWRNHYAAEDDPRSPFYGHEYSEFEFSTTIYNHYIHPQWDSIESPTLFIKIIFADYEDGYAVIELMGEWNDCLNNDIMFLKREILEHLMNEGIYKFILIAENVLNFHSSDDCYYEEWFEEVEDENGWIALLNSREHVLESFTDANIDNYFVMGGNFEQFDWRIATPIMLFQKVESYVMKRLSLPLR